MKTVAELAGLATAEEERLGELVVATGNASLIAALIDSRVSMIRWFNAAREQLGPIRHPRP